MYMNVECFYDDIEDKWNLHSNILKDYILVNISVGLTRNKEMRNDIERLYKADKLKYYDAYRNSTCIDNVIMSQGSLEQEIHARRMLGVLLVAEKDKSLRNEIIKLLRKHYYLIYRAVKKCSNKELITKYLGMDIVDISTEKRLDGAVYLYFVMYCYTKKIDYNHISFIINDIKNYSMYSPMTTNIDKEVEDNYREIQDIKSLVKETYGEFLNYNDILRSENDDVIDIDGIIENIFMINKIDITQFFDKSQDVNIDNIILACIKGNDKKLKLKDIIQAVINGIYVQSFINEYKKSRDIYFKNSQETLYFKLHSLEKKVNSLESENKEMEMEIKSLKNEKAVFDKTLNSEINKLNKNHNSEIFEIKKDIRILQDQLDREREYRYELNNLREYMFQVKNEYIPIKSDKTLDHYIKDKNILIIGGSKYWRMRFKEKYNEIRTLNGFNENFDISILKSVDYVFFYTGLMSHSTYNKAMKVIRINQIKFGYIGKTNIDLVEEEIIEELKKCDIGGKANLSD
ncbi:MAG: hypothetical protein ABF633_13845 [Clostridium sp.]|uniref:hypothetical protein n=1 Tax=Clostridium sp. TaxID=1506 RepID=UPI0039EBC010